MLILPSIRCRLGRHQWFYQSMGLNLWRSSGDRIVRWCGRCRKSR